MTLHYASDLHLERIDNQNWLQRQPLSCPSDVLVLAGDVMPISQLHQHQDFVHAWGDRYQQVLWVPGNHEHYGGDITERGGPLDEKLTSNVRLLNNATWCAPGLRILCTTLWTPIAPADEEMMQHYVADYKAIRDGAAPLRPRATTALHAASVAWLRNELATPFAGHTVVVTHHVPTFANYPSDLAGTILATAFAADLDELVTSSGGTAWIYGHHHRNGQAFQLGATRMLTNQLGYLEYGEGNGFNYKARLDFTTA